ncbi:Splicing factor 3A subunit 3 [Camellia lanceoleosa]|uniref:Splicing factor 3A subunit 3 n=1 Tax=Camellia lanceoleosa TaxID=1840588 RepID=A0ACC0GZE6_9ERIC|nr:Splicing factor 3A subunit 3 [Camellia lanceoleosa]
MIDEITSTTLKLVEIYEDKDSARKDEIAIREYHRRHPAARVVDVNDEYEELLKEELRIEFTGRSLFLYLYGCEALGRYLDLHELYNEYINSKFAEPIEYSAYLDVFLNRIRYLQTEIDQNGAQENGYVSAQPAVIDLDYYSTVEELMEVGPERLKEALAALGLKTGGTTQQRAERLFLTKHTPLEQLDRKHFAKGSREEVQADTESDDDEQQIYNPLKLLMVGTEAYTLLEFKCEICGNHSYWGRRAYERHFKEWRHQHGMRCLGIPNTKNFNEITSIEEAKQLWERIQERQGVNKWRPDLEEEYEDKEGNIYNKKTYTDLQRQGLI